MYIDSFSLSSLLVSPFSSLSLFLFSYGRYSGLVCWGAPYGLWPVIGVCSFWVRSQCCDKSTTLAQHFKAQGNKQKPESTGLAYTGIAVVIDRSAKYALYHPAMLFKLPKEIRGARVLLELSADSFAEKLNDAHARLNHTSFRKKNRCHLRPPPPVRLRVHHRVPPPLSPAAHVCIRRRTIRR